jgi:predicted enzyme related to lactoylglutathione lyase
MATIDYFEIPAEDVSRAREFYSKLFEWKFEKSGQWDYWMFGTTSEKGEPALAGGLYKKDNPQRPILDYIGVESIDDYTAKVTQLGGEVLVPKTDTGGMGFYAICQDTENNTFGLWEAAKKVQ